MQAARDTAASRDALIELFDKIASFFGRLKIYTEVPPTAEMTNVMVKIMAEVLSMLAIATKKLKQKRLSELILPPSFLSLTLLETFFQKLIGRNEVEDALLRLDKLEQGELQTVSAQVLKTTCDLKDVASDIKDGAKLVRLSA